MQVIRRPRFVPTEGGRECGVLIVVGAQGARCSICLRLLRAGVDKVHLPDKHGLGLLVMALRAQRQRPPSLGVELLGVTSSVGNVVRAREDEEQAYGCNEPH